MFYLCTVDVYTCVCVYVCVFVCVCMCIAVKNMKTIESVSMETDNSCYLLFYYAYICFCEPKETHELIYQLNAIEYLLCTFSSTFFGLTRPSSGAMDVKFLYIYSIWCPWCS